jgi:phosphonopyruvate decarboxylase
MINSKEIIKIFDQNQLNFFTGVPCSIFKDLLVSLNSQKKLKHIPATGEGEAIGIAVGHYLSTGYIPVVYMQNSGLGNAINPLTSLADKTVFSIPLLLLISWRGEPGTHDEPEHTKMGLILIPLLDLLEIPYQIFNPEKLDSQIKNLRKEAVNKQTPVALIFKKGQIEEVGIKSDNDSNLMTREEALEILARKIGNHPIISTTGKTSRELYEIRERNNQKHDQDFLMVGSMGCASPIGVGISQNTKDKIFVIDGDGAALMRLSINTTVGEYCHDNFVYIVINNSVYDSTGEQSLSDKSIKWKQFFKAINFQKVVYVKMKTRLKSINLNTNTGPMAIVIKVKPGSRQDLGRPSLTPIENKIIFSKYLQHQK